MYVIDEKNCSKVYYTTIDKNGNEVEKYYIDKDYMKYKKYEFLLDQNYNDYGDEPSQ